MQTFSGNNKRIIKNTLFLYVRMLIILAVNLFTVRIIFRVLGVEDYGIYNVVAGFVVSFTFLANTTSTAIQRFLSYTLGLQKYDDYHKYFVNSFFLFVILAIIALLLLGSIGIWFLHNKMTIPLARIDAAVWIYYSAMLSLLFSFISIPYNAVILSNERMDLFAYLSVIDAFVKLLIAYLLFVIYYDHLKVYAVLLSISEIVKFLLYKYFANRICIYSKLSSVWNISYIKSLLSFTSWNLIGSISGLCRNQGLNVLINIYFGPIYNAAVGISFQMYHAINNFASNFIVAANPQIIKLYASGERNEWERLVIRSSKMAFSLLSFISFPFILLLPYVLKLWLGYSSEIIIEFSRLIVLNMLVECVSMPLLTLAQATGRLKYYQIIVGGSLILNLPISWILLKYLHMDAYVVYVVLICLNLVALFLRLIILRKTAGLNFRCFIKQVVIKWFYVIVSIGICYYFFKEQTLLMQLGIIILYMSLLMPSLVLFVVFDKSERNGLYSYIKHKIKR